MLVIAGCSTSRATECMITASRKVGPRRARPWRYIGASMCTKGSGTNSVKPPVSTCRSRSASRWRDQASDVSTWPYMMVEVVRRPSLCAARCTSSHCAGVDLVGADDGAHLVVEDLGRRARQGAEAGLLQLRQEGGERRLQGRGALRHLERREGVDVHAGHRRLDGAADRDVGLAGVVRMDAALQADLGGAALPGLDARAATPLPARDRRARRADPRACGPWRRRRSGSGNSRCWCS